jgi:integrase
MSTDTAPNPNQDRLDELLREASDRLARAKARNTLLSYEADWHRFEIWCDSHGLPSLPATPRTVGAYLTDAARPGARRGGDYAPSTLARWLYAINHRHRMAGHAAPGQHPHITELLASIRRDKARPPARKEALLRDDLHRVLSHMLRDNQWPGVVAATRDACLLLFGFAGAFRRSELAELLVDHVTLRPEDGLRILVPRSKGDQEASGQMKAIPYGAVVDTCAPCAYVRWRRLVRACDAGGRPAVLRALRQPQPADDEGHVCRSVKRPSHEANAEAVFRPVDRAGRISPGTLSGWGVYAIVKRRAAAAGYPRMSAHSLRIGFVTQARRNEAANHEIMRQTGHKTDAMIEVYTRYQDPGDRNAVKKLGL